MVLEYIPREYTNLAKAWGIRAEYGNLVAFTASLILISAIVWLGAILSFGRLIRENESGKKALIVISVAIGFIATYGAAAAVVSILSNLVYTIAMLGAIFVLIAVSRALWAGVPAAGATVAEARKMEYEAKAELERARRLYEEERHMRMLALKKIADDLASLADYAEKLIDEVLNNFENNPYLKATYNREVNRLNELKNRLKESQNKPAAIYATLDELTYVLSTVSDITELSEELKRKIKDAINKIRTGLKKIESESRKAESKKT